MSKKTCVWNQDEKAWTKETLVDNVISDYSRMGRIMRTPKQHADLYEADPTDEEINAAAVEGERS